MEYLMIMRGLERLNEEEILRLRHRFHDLAIK